MTTSTPTGNAAPEMITATGLQKPLAATANITIIMYTVKDISIIFKCSLSKAYAIVNIDGFPAIKIGHDILVEENALKVWIEKNKGKKILI